MYTVLSFAGISFLIALLSLLAGGVGIPFGILIALGAFLLCHVFYLIFFWLAGRTVPMDKPIEKQNRICRMSIGPMASIAAFYLGVHSVVTGMDKLPKDQRFLFVSNHRSAFDPIVAADRLRDYEISFISKPSNMRLPLLSRVGYSVGFLPIDRENNRNALKTILAAADYLKKDICSIGVYPEGTRCKTNEMLPFHAGSLKIAQKGNAPIVVACVYGSENVRKAKLFSSTTIHLDILDVIPAETVCSLSTGELSDTIRTMIQEHLDQTEGAGS